MKLTESRNDAAPQNDNENEEESSICELGEEGQGEEGEDEFYDPEVPMSNPIHNPCLAGNDIMIDLPNADDIDDVDNEPDAF